MLTEGAKPGTPHITPRKIYPDGIDLFIEVVSSSDHLVIIEFKSKPFLFLLLTSSNFVSFLKIHHRSFVTFWNTF